jgi:hypothetical protein
VVAALLDAGLDPEGRDHDGQTALIVYCLSQQVHVDPIRILVTAGLRVDARDQRERTPLHWTVANEQVNRRAIPALLDLGADIEARDSDGMTPLLLAAGIERNSFPIVYRLLERGANTQSRTPEGRTARDIVAQQVAELEKQDATPGQMPSDPALAVEAPAQRRLRLRSARVALAALSEPGTSTSETPANLPEPIWLGYRARRPNGIDSTCGAVPDHIERVCTFGHTCGTGGMNKAACHATPEFATAAWLQYNEGGQPRSMSSVPSPCCLKTQERPNL